MSRRPSKEPLATSPGSRWRRAILHAKIVARLKNSIVLRDGRPGTPEIEDGRAAASHAVSPTGHCEYLRKLRVGVKHMMAISAMGREMHIRSSVAAEKAQAAQQIAAGNVQTMVESAAALKLLERWQQGDSTMYAAHTVHPSAIARLSPQPASHMAAMSFTQAVLRSISPHIQCALHSVHSVSAALRVLLLPHL